MVRNQPLQKMVHALARCNSMMQLHNGGFCKVKIECFCHFLKSIAFLVNEKLKIRVVLNLSMLLQKSIVMWQHQLNFARQPFPLKSTNVPASWAIKHPQSHTWASIRSSQFCETFTLRSTSIRCVLWRTRKPCHTIVTPGQFWWSRVCVFFCLNNLYVQFIYILYIQTYSTTIINNRDDTSKIFLL